MRAPASAERRLGPYVLSRLIAQGGMAEVYEARREGPHGFAKRVAIKCILPQLSNDERLVHMFCDEARVQASLNHPNLVHLVDFGEHESELFIALEFVDGISCLELLQAVQARKTTVDAGVALHIAREVLRGLEHVHSMRDEFGIPMRLVHRDIAPNNILLGVAGQVKIADFGIVRGKDIDSRTRPGELKGKVGYVSPEQAMGYPVDARSDLFSLAVVLAELLIGRSLFSGDGEFQVLANLHAGDISNLRVYGRHLPDQVHAVLHRALEKQPKDRYPDATIFGAELDQLILDLDLGMGSYALAEYLTDLGLIALSSSVREVTLSEHDWSDDSINDLNGWLDDDEGPTLPKAPNPIAAGRPVVELAEAPIGGAFEGAVPNHQASTLPPPLTGLRQGDVVLHDIAAEHAAAQRATAEHSTAEPAADEVTVRLGPKAKTQAQAEARRGTSAEPEPPERAEPVFHVRGSSGGVSEALPIARVLELIATGRLKANVRLSRNGGPFQSLSTLPECARLASRPPYRFGQAMSADGECPVLDSTLPGHLYGVVLSRRTGLLLARDADRQVRVYFEEGAPCFSSSTEAEHLLGNVVRDAAGVSAEQIERCVRQAAERGMRLGESLLSAKVVDSPGLNRALAVQLENRLAWLCSWRRGTLSFLDGEVSGDAASMPRVSPLAILTRAVLRSYDDHTIQRLLAPLWNVPLGYGRDAHRILPQLELHGACVRAIELAATGVTLSRLVSDACTQNSGVSARMRGLFVGVVTGVLRAG